MLDAYGLQGLRDASQNTVQTIDNTLAKAQNVISLFPGAPPNATKQAKAYSQLFTAMQQKLPMQIDTPYRVLKDMIIEQIVFVQPRRRNTGATSP